MSYPLHPAGIRTVPKRRWRRSGAGAPMMGTRLGRGTLNPGSRPPQCAGLAARRRRYSDCRPDAGMRTEFDHPAWPEATLDHTGIRPPARARVLHEIFEAQADARPDDVAVVSGAKAVTYAELERRANRVAFHLRARGVGRGSVAALLLPRSPDAYAALLGILKAGAAYLPLDPEYPPDRIGEILEDSAATALVTTASLAERVASPPGIVVRLDADHRAIEAGPAERPSPATIGLRPRDLCYVIYTSGSTGRPKGVMIEHRSACHFVQAERFFGVRPGDRVYQGFSLAFDASVEEIWLAFQAGATLIAATPEMARAGPDLSRRLREAGVTVLSCVPTLLSMLTDDVPGLRLLILGGECCPAGLAARWIRPGRRVINTYGPTEATVCATYAELAPGRPVTIGRPLPGYRVHLLDDRLRPVPPGAAGEICIGGLGVARGYLGRPDETLARFITDPFAPISTADARLYRTGDRARLNAAGDFEFLGRTDTQVKIRGFRVELAEIEAVLLQAEGVAAAACAVREELPGVQQLVGYVVPAAGRPVDDERLRVLARGRLPAWMVPSVIESIAELPTLPSGKLDRDALPAPRPRAVESGSDGRPPESDAECAIAAVWRDLFRPLRVSADDDFFLDLGGHSLLAARMVSELRRDPRFARVSVLDVYQHPRSEERR